MRERIILNFANVHILNELTFNELQIMLNTGIKKLIIHLHHQSA
jgi:hypothetical protein